MEGLLFLKTDSNNFFNRLVSGDEDHDRLNKGIKDFNLLSSSLNVKSINYNLVVFPDRAVYAQNLISKYFTVNGLLKRRIFSYLDSVDFILYPKNIPLTFTPEFVMTKDTHLSFLEIFTLFIDSLKLIYPEKKNFLDMVFKKRANFFWLAPGYNGDLFDMLNDLEKKDYNIKFPHLANQSVLLPKSHEFFEAIDEWQHDKINERVVILIQSTGEKIEPLFKLFFSDYLCVRIHGDVDKNQIINFEAKKVIQIITEKFL